MIIDYPDELFNEEELENTPKRVKKFFDEWKSSEKFNFTKFTNKDKNGELIYDQMIALTDIPLASLCSHHLLPFTGKAHIAYIPSEQICGLSKIARVVDYFAHRPQLQERLTKQIADYLKYQLNCRGVMVVIEAEHTCMTIRGIKKPGSITKTSALKGTFETDKKARDEFLALIYGGRK